MMKIIFICFNQSWQQQKWRENYEKKHTVAANILLYSFDSVAVSERKIIKIREKHNKMHNNTYKFDFKHLQFLVDICMENIFSIVTFFSLFFKFRLRFTICNNKNWLDAFSLKKVGICWNMLTNNFFYK